MFKHLLRLALSIAVSLAILALILQLVTTGLGEEQRPSVWSALGATTKWVLFAYLGLYFVQLYFRASRYRLLLSISGQQNLPSMGQMAMVTGVRNMFVDMLPARVGELAYVALLNRGYGVEVKHGLSSLGIAIVFDFVALLIIAVAIVIKQLVGANVELWALNATLLIFVVTVIGLAAVFYVFPYAMTRLRQPLAFERAPNWWSKLLDWGVEFAQSITQVRSSGRLFRVTILSLIIRVIKYTGMYLLFMAVAVPSFASLASLPFEQVVGALVGGEVGSSLPIPTFMSFGTYEAGSTLVFQLLGVVNQAEAFVTMLSVHIWSQLMDYTIGGILLACFILFHRRAKNLQLQGSQDSAQTTPTDLGFRRWQIWAAYGFATIALGGATLFLTYQLWAASKLGASSAPEPGTISELAAEQRQAALAQKSGVDGFVVFSSNRDGNHDIFKLELSNSQLTKLTDHPNTETYPRISPDGTRLVFARAHQPWVSQRNTKAWDIWVLDLDSGESRKVGERGTAPQWVDDQRISYVKNTQSVVVVDIGSAVSLSDAEQALSEEVVFQASERNGMPANAEIYNARYNPLNQQTTFTARQSTIGLRTGHWGTAIGSVDRVTGVFNGCELFWNSAYDGLFQVTPSQGPSSTEIVRVNPETLSTKTLIDLTGEFSHEYWPKDSNDGRYMVFGASRGPQDHEHDTKDYEIFLWRVGSDPSVATRLTFHTGNDNWPDVHIRP